VLEIALRNNSEVEAYRLRAEAEQALIKTAFSIDKTSVYYNYDENNIAANNYPIGVFGGEQRFDFPTVYFAQKKANTLAYEMAVNQYMGKKNNYRGRCQRHISDWSIFRNGMPFTRKWTACIYIFSRRLKAAMKKEPLPTWSS
jgi:hypothetical protein